MNNSSILVISLTVMLGGCTYSTAPTTDKLVHSIKNTCIGTTAVTEALSNQFITSDDPALLNRALGEPTQGKLCQGQVYISKQDSQITLFRAWNSTNPNSKFGNWWAFNEPSGSITKYRSDYEICYQWSPLDKLVRCTLKAGTKVVIGTGQSTQCSEYLSYPTSMTQQIYIKNAKNAFDNCEEFDGQFNWK